MQATLLSTVERVNLTSQLSLMYRYHQNDLNSDTQMNATMNEEDLDRKSRHQRHYNEGSKTCPVCGLTVRRQELEIHFQSEIEKLQKLTTEGSRSLRYPKRKRKPTQDEEEEEPVSSARYEKYLSTRRKRETRKRSKMLRDSGPSGSGLSSPNCPVCGMTLVGTPEEMNEHAEACLNKQALAAGNESDGEDVNIDVEDNFEEYTWCGETRIRATTLLEGGLQGCGYKTVQKSKDENADEELDVEGDESMEFGPSQFTETDLIHLVETPEEETSSRGTGTLEGERHSNVYHDRGQSSIAENNNESSENDQSVRSNGEVDYLRPCHPSTNHSKELVKSLKAQVSALRQQMEERSSVRCLVCLDSYKKPVVSIQCWHVYCEDCWMRTLGAKKLCPQCQMITSPSQLRQIFL